MQFNSVQSGSFLTGAKSVNQNVTDIYNTAIQTGFNADQVIKQANANDAVKQMATARRQASMANTAMNALATAKVEDLKDKLIDAYWKKQYTKLEQEFFLVKNSIKKELEEIIKGG